MVPSGVGDHFQAKFSILPQTMIASICNTRLRGNVLFLKRAYYALIEINYMTFGKGIASFPAMTELKQTAQLKNYNVTNIIIKGGPSNHQIGVTIHTLFL